ncbi:MAG TPA: acetoacetyl-CoA reductase [Nevskiales bacterium]|nr:acetoacetyl-CoA reductase [Nevskiales bacterium]
MTRHAVVTGGTGAIGTEICRQLAQAGHRVTAIGHPAEAQRLPAWRESLQRDGFGIGAELCDLSDWDACVALAPRLGEVDILVNAAGITRDARLVKMTPEQWRAVMAANLDSVFNLTRQLIEGMCARGHGRIVNISSVNGQKGQAGQTNYSASKAGLHGFTLALAREVAGKGVTVNTVSPGYIDTPMIRQVREEIRVQILKEIPVGRFGTPADIARAVLFLVDDAAGFITGADLSVNGGQYMA